MATIEQTDKGLAQFLPQVPRTPPIAPRAERQNRATRATARQSRRAAPSTPAPAAAVPQAPVVGETEETRRDKTVRMGQARMVNALRSVRLLGNLASRNYDWHEGEPDRMEQTLIDAVRQTFAKFKHTRERQKLEDTFRLVDVE